MERPYKIGCLAVAAAVTFGAMTVMAVFPEVLERSPLLGWMLTPALIITPWGPPVLLTALFAMLGSPRPWKKIARMVAAIAFSIVWMFVTISYAFVGMYAPGPAETIAAGGVTVAALIMAAWGFSRDREPQVAPPPRP